MDISTVWMGYKWALADYRRVFYSMDGLLVDNNRTWIRYQLVLAWDGLVISGLLTVHGWVKRGHSQMGFKLAPIEHGWVISWYLQDTDELSVDSSRTSLGCKWT